jgi:hypothetical protein
MSPNPGRNLVENLGELIEIDFRFSPRLRDHDHPQPDRHAFYSQLAIARARAQIGKLLQVLDKIRSLGCRCAFAEQEPDNREKQKKHDQGADAHAAAEHVDRIGAQIFGQQVANELRRFEFRHGFILKEECTW